MSFTFCTSEAILMKAGVGRNEDVSGALLAEWCNFAEGQVILATRRDWRASSSSINVDVTNALGDAISDVAAMKLISYDMTLFFSKEESQTKLDVLRDNSQRIIKDLEDFDSNNIKGV